MPFTILWQTILSGRWNSIVTIVVSHLALLLVVHFLQPRSDTNCRIEEASCSTRGGVNSAFFKFFKDRETFEEFSCKTLLYHRDKSQQHTRDLYWFGLLTYSSPQATPLENSLKTLVKLPYKKQGTLANTCPCASLFSTSFARDNLTFHTSTTQSIAFDDLVAEL